MTRDTERRTRRVNGQAETSARARRSPNFSIEPLEGRVLLSLWQGPTRSRPLFTGGAFYQVAVTGPGYETITPLAADHKLVAINLYGTTASSTLSVTFKSSYRGFHNAHLQVGQINVVSGQLGGVKAAGAADLVGPMTPLNNSLSSLQFGTIGRNATVDVAGSVANFGAGVNLGPNGHINIAGDLAGPTSIPSLAIDGGSFNVGHDVSGPLNTGRIAIQRGGQFAVGHDLAGPLTDTGDIALNSDGLLSVGHNLGGLNVSQNLNFDGDGRLLVGNDVTGAVTVGQGMNLTNNGLFVVGRDLTGGLTVTGDLDLASTGRISVGRDLDGLTVTGNINEAPAGTAIAVGGNLNNLTVTGDFRGKGTSEPDLVVGLNLNNLSVTGGSANQGGLQQANFDVGKNIQGLNVPHGIFNSFITAGVLIDGTGGGPAGNIGPDGPDAIFDSEIRAGVEINHLTIGGNVRSDFPTNPTPSPASRPTRILAGINRQGVLSSGGNIENFQITGTLIDSVIAASVLPYGGNGTLPNPSYSNPLPAPTGNSGDLGYNTYDAPAGVIVGGTPAMPVAYPNYSEVSYTNEIPTGVAYNTAVDKTIDDLIYPGAINTVYATPPNIAVPAIATASYSLPSTSTVLGGVISTPHGDQFDYAGIFAADTRGVFVGTLPNTPGG